MSKNKNRKNNRGFFSRERKPSKFSLPHQTKQWIAGILMILAAVLVILSFFNRSGVAGKIFIKSARSAIGDTVFIIPLVLVLGGLVFFNSKYRIEFGKKERSLLWPIILAVFLITSGATGFLGALNGDNEKGGWWGYIIGWPFLKYFGFWATQIIFSALMAIGAVIFWDFLKPEKSGLPENKEEVPLQKKESSIIKKIFGPKFKVKEINPVISAEPRQSEKAAPPLKLETKPIGSTFGFSYQPPPLDLLESDKGTPSSGDTRVNAAVIKKTLQNFGIEVAMSEVNIGPTVTQYTFKPAEGVKLSKITGLSNDLSLALASHPIRIEAPIPGRSLVGIEMPNKVRARVGLRSLFEHANFQKSSSNLLLALGKDVSGTPIFSDLARMPHLLVAGSTGTGKTIFLNSLILSLLYQPNNGSRSADPQALRFILVDPKRVEFPVYSNLPHLLCPVIYNAAQTVNVLRWLTGEMERRFDVLSEARARDIASFNEYASKNETDPLPFIVVVIDELADLMAAKGREIEAGIVRLAQMSRAVGIHLVVATQRPSVEVITGLIKANITSRVTFQLASQVDSRTVLDMSGAEKLLGAGDMLHLSAETVRARRIQGAYVSDKEVKRVMNYIISKGGEFQAKSDMEIGLIQEIERTPEESSEFNGGGQDQDDSLYEDAKKVVIEANKASASFLQRRLRVGYARAARLLDILEDKGVVGPGEGAKAREVYTAPSNEQIPVPRQENRQASGGEENNDEWEKL